jgi:hypothetical protein
LKQLSNLSFSDERFIAGEFDPKDGFVAFLFTDCELVAEVRGRTRTTSGTIIRSGEVEARINWSAITFALAQRAMTQPIGMRGARIPSCVS